jgi:hypothetical protein
MWRTLQITWRILWRCLELVIVVYVLSQITDHNTSLIVGVLGLVRSFMAGSPILVPDLRAVEREQQHRSIAR